MRICAYSAITEADACWIPQYLAEVERLNIPFVIHLDRCSEATIDRLTNHRLCMGFTEQPDPTIEFQEMHKQRIMDLVIAMQYDWALAWDVDETWDARAPQVLATLAYHTADYFDCPWFNLWNDGEHIRIDRHFGAGHRVKLYRLHAGISWEFYHPTVNGARAVGREPVLGQLSLVCLHHGMLTPAMRQFHKERWDRIYTTAVGANPYGFWKDAVDETLTPILIRHGYFHP